MWYISLLYLSLHLGSAVFIKHPTNVTTCQGLSAVFTCGINETTTIIWFINGIDSRSSICSPPKSETVTQGPVQQSTLTCPATSQLQGASVQCHYVLGLQLITSYFAYLMVQDLPSNLTIIEHNATFVKLAWVPPSAFQSPSLSTYTVVVKRGNGTLVYNETVRESQLVVPTPDPCDYYEATVSSQCGLAKSSIGNAIKLIGVPPSTISSGQVNFSFVLNKNNVTLDVIIPFEQVCYFKLVAAAVSDMLTFPYVKPIRSSQGYSTISVSLLPNNHFNLTITAFNTNGNTSYTVSINTYVILDITVNTSSIAGLVCKFNHASLAIGCLVTFMDNMTMASYCKVVQRFMKVPVKVLSCLSSYDGPLSRGVYSVLAYGIENDGSLSPVPAVVQTLTVATALLSTPTTLTSSNVTINTSLWTIVGSTVSGFLVVALLIASIIIAFHLKCKRGNKMSATQKSLVTTVNNIIFDQCAAYHSDFSNEPMKFSLTSMMVYKEVFDDALVCFDELKIESKPIGEGAFGVVYKATFTRPHHGTEVVAVKTIKALRSENELKSFFEESTRMKSFKHPNIVELLGMCLDSPDGVPLMVLPFLVHGNLKSYLQQSRGFSPKLDEYPNNLCCTMLVSMCLDIAKGMKYLADQKFVHRDLAARNCLVDVNLNIKVADFGMTRDTYETNYYRMSKAKDCPVKWMPPEMLQDGISSEKSDVWAFGVTCWEVFSLGATPYPGVENHQMLEHINKGLRLQKPALCPNGIFYLVEQCWLYEPRSRPLFDTLVAELKYEGHNY
ncbi:hypothetical protein EMCRGX_G023363 [Ephydatia muelleri]